jgi:hypothetical protein
MDKIDSGIGDTCESKRVFLRVRLDSGSSRLDGGGKEAAGIN